MVAPMKHWLPALLLVLAACGDSAAKGDASSSSGGGPGDGGVGVGDGDGQPAGGAHQAAQAVAGAERLAQLLVTVRTKSTTHEALRSGGVRATA